MGWQNTLSASGVLDLRNEACFDNSAVDYNNVGGSFGDLLKCASSDTTGSAGFQNLVASTVFQSVVNTDSNFVMPVKGEALNGAGVILQ